MKNPCRRWPDPTYGDVRDAEKTYLADTTFVYVIHADGYGVKVGYSANPERRFAQIQGASPLKMKLVGYIPGDMRTERYIQARLRVHRLRERGEWFSEAVLPLLERILAEPDRFLVPVAA